LKKNLRLKSRLVCATALLLGYAASAQAAPVSKTYQFTATSFTPIVDPSSISPYSTVTGAFTLTFDPLVSMDETQSGIVLNSLSIPLGSAVAFRYDYITSLDIGVIQIGGSQDGINALGGFNDDFYLTFQWTGTGPLRFGGFDYSNGSVVPNEAFLAGAGSVRAVPEPASWALMIGGFGLVGCAFRQRRGTVAAYR
jgi:hypothetical protein